MSASPINGQNRPLRIFHLIKSLGRGGAEVLLIEGLKHADRDRFTYGYGYFLPWKDAVVPELEQQGAEVVCFGARSNPAILFSTWKVACFLKAWGADLVHCHLPIAGVVGRLAGKLAGVPVVYTEHNEMDRYHPFTRWTNLATWDLQERVIAVSDEVKEAAQRFADDRTPIQVVWNGVDTNSFHPGSADGQAIRKQWDIPSDASLIGTIAVFREQKRIDDWLQAARRIYEARSEVRFLIVGEGPLREQLEARQRGLGLKGTVQFVGFQGNVKPYLEAMDVYMMSSGWEGLPIALLEAMAMGCPVVATAVGGIPHVVRDKMSGFLVEVGDVEGLAHAAGTLAVDAEKRKEMGRAARATVVERFSMRRMTRELESIYLDVLSR